MRKLAAVIAAILVAQFAGGAGPFSSRLSESDLRHVKVVAVISALGSSFQFERIPAAPFEWIGPPDSHFLEISEWALDDRITRDVALAVGNRFAVKTIQFVPATFMSWSDSSLKQASFELNGDPSIDAYILVLRDWRADEYGYSVHDLGGLGLYRRDDNQGPPKFGLYACYRIVVVDALTGNIMASRAANENDGRMPWASLDVSLWPKTQNDVTQVQKNVFIAGETRLIEETLSPTLRKMNLAR